MQLVMDEWLLSREEKDVYQVALKKANEEFCGKVCHESMERTARAMVLSLIESEDVYLHLQSDD